MDSIALYFRPLKLHEQTSLCSYSVDHNTQRIPLSCVSDHWRRTDAMSKEDKPPPSPNHGLFDPSHLLGELEDTSVLLRVLQHGLDPSHLSPWWVGRNRSILEGVSTWSSTLVYLLGELVETSVLLMVTWHGLDPSALHGVKKVI